MPRIAALTPGLNVASSRFRIRQYIPDLAKAGIMVDEFPAKIAYSIKLPGFLGEIRQRYTFPLSGILLGAKILSRIPDIINANKYNFIWLNKYIVNSYHLEKFLKSQIIYDIDDAIWINNRKKIGSIASKARLILAGNDFIAENLKAYNTEIRIIPTAVDTSRFKPYGEKKEGIFNIVWTGSKDTIHYLASIEKPLSEFLNNTKDSRLIIISDGFPELKLIRPDRIRHVNWSEENEVKYIQGSSLGIMPLFDTDWEKGKCSYKMLQYMACGLPVIVSPVGMNNQVLSKGETGLSATGAKDWLDKISYLYKNQDTALKMGIEGQKVIAENYSLSVISRKLIEIFNKI